MIDFSLTRALAGFYARAWFTPALKAYLRDNALDLNVILPHVGACAVIPIVDCSNGRFDFGRVDVDPLGFVYEVLGEDGESTEDLIGWHIPNPDHVMSMLGRTGIVGLWRALNPATYYLGKPLIMHRTPLEWLKAGCQGAAVVNKRIAARQFLELPGALAGKDQRHGRELLAIAESVIDRRRFVAARHPKEAV